MRDSSTVAGATAARKAGYWPLGGRVSGGLGRGPRLGAEIQQDCEHAARLAPARGQAELAEDAGDVLLDGAERDHELVCYPLVRAAFGHQFEYLALAWRQFGERIVAPTLGEQGRDDDRVDRRAAG